MIDLFLKKKVWVETKLEKIFKYELQIYVLVANPFFIMSENPVE